MAGGAPGHGEAAPGDHLQTLYHLWLPGHQVEHGRAPWRDPYSFRPEASPTIDFAGWPFGVPFWPLDAALGHVRAWNAFLLLTYLAAGGLACLWLRELALWAFERRRLALAVAATASIPLSGQVHLALGAVPFVCAYALVRRRDFRTIVAVEATVGAAVAAAFLVKITTIDRSHLKSGRSLHAVSQYAAHWGDFLSRHKGDQPEQFVFLGWATPVLAVIGLVLLWRTRRGLALVLAFGAVVPILLALGTHTPLYSPLWHALPPLHYPRVPERLLPVACLCIAALVAFAVARSRSGLVAALAIALLFVDLHVHVYRASAADERNGAYAALRAAPPGRVLELPVFMPDLHYGGVYQYYDMQALRERPGGYSTVAPRAAYDLMRTLLPLNCGRLDGAQLEILRRLGVRYVAVHRALFRYRRVEGAACTPPSARRLRSFPRLARDGGVTIFMLRRR
jgi:hypothetical protein